MSRKATVPASPDALVRHVIQYVATGPDGVETAGLATVTGTAHTIPWSQLAAIPGFRTGDTIREHDDDPTVWLLGPGPDAPGHAAWCVDHQDNWGDGRSLCWGETSKFGGESCGASVQLTQITGGGAVVWFHADVPDQGEELTPGQARERALELRRIADQLDVLAEQAEVTAAVAAVSA